MEAFKGRNRFLMKTVIIIGTYFYNILYGGRKGNGNRFLLKIAIIIETIFLELPV